MLNIFKGKTIDSKFLSGSLNFIRENGSTLSMIGSLISLGITIYEAFKASNEISEINESYAKKVKEIETSGISGDEKAKELKDLKMMRNLSYISAEKKTIVFGVASGGLIVLTKYIDGLAISGLAALAMTKQEEIKKLGENAKKMIGEEKFKKIEDKTLEEMCLKNFINDGDPVALKPSPGCGTVFVDTASGAWFQQDKEDMEKILEEAEKCCARNHYLYQDIFLREMIKIEPPEEPIQKQRRWGPTNPFKAHIGTRQIYGVTIPSIEYEYQPQPIKG